MRTHFYMKHFFVTGLVALILMASCQPKPDMSKLTKNLVVETDYNSTATFSNYSTYALILDTIGYYDNSDPNPADTLATGSYPQVITTQIKFKMDSLGYTMVSSNASPDLWVYPYVSINYSAYTYYNPYSYGYYGGYGGYGGYYGGYGGYSTSITETGDFYIYIFDLKHKSSGPYVWASDIWDLVSSPDQTSATLQRAINQAFKQSPYLKH